MKALRKLAIFLAALTATTSAYGQAAMPQVTADQAVSAVSDCARATGPDGVDVAALIDMGWQETTAESDDGQPIDLPLTILGKEQGGRPLIMTGKPGSDGNRACIITGGFDPAGFDGLLAALSEEFQATGSRDGEHQFRVGSDFAIAAHTGNGDSFRIAVLEPGDS